MTTLQTIFLTIIIILIIFTEFIYRMAKLSCNNTKKEDKKKGNK